MANNNGEPSSAPQPDRWYTLKLGSSFDAKPLTKFSTLRYEFKPASIDKSQPGSLHKNKENRISVEFQNNQPGKPKVTFEGSSEDYKDNDGVLFFDGETFRLERLHRAVKRLRHVRLPGESASAANQTSLPSTGTGMDSRSSPLAKAAKIQISSKPIARPVSVEVEKIDIGEPESPGPKPTNKSHAFQSVSEPHSLVSPDRKSSDLDLDNLDILGDDDDDDAPNKPNPMDNSVFGFDMNIPNQNNSDEEIADVDVSDDANDGPNAAEALRALVNAEGGQQQEPSSSSSGSGSSGSSSGSDSSSSDSDGSDEDSASSAGDIDI